MNAGPDEIAVLPLLSHKTAAFARRMAADSRANGKRGILR
jgi:hypothetical protein